MIWVYRFILTPILTLSPENCVSTIIYFFLISLAICTVCRKKHRERVTNEAEWLKTETTDEPVPFQRLGQNAF